MSNSPLLLPSLLALAGLEATAAAQSERVWPAAYATRSGAGAQNTPFTVTASNPQQRTRSMTTMAAGSLPFRAGSVLTQIAYRRDSRYSSASYAACNGGTLKVEIGTVVRADRPETTFAKNWTQEPANVFEGSFDLPAAGPPGAGPAPFTLTIPFAQSWTYPGGDLGVDLLFSGSPAGPWRRDAALVAVQTSAEFSQVGPGCRGTNGIAPYTYPFLESGAPGKTVIIHLTGAVLPRNAYSFENYAINFLGVSATEIGSIPLPLDLSPIGFPQGCKLRTDFFAVQVIRTGNPSTLFTRAEASWPIPAEPALTGGRFYSQWVCNDSALTSTVKLTLSSACSVSLGAADPNPRALLGATIWRYGAVGGGTESGGLAGPEYVAITRFTGMMQ